MNINLKNNLNVTCPVIKKDRNDLQVRKRIKLSLIISYLIGGSVACIAPSYGMDEFEEQIKYTVQHKNNSTNFQNTRENVQGTTLPLKMDWYEYGQNAYNNFTNFWSTIENVPGKKATLKVNWYEYGQNLNNTIVEFADAITQFGRLHGQSLAAQMNEYALQLKNNFIKFWSTIKNVPGEKATLGKHWYEYGQNLNNTITKIPEEIIKLLQSYNQYLEYLNTSKIRKDESPLETPNTYHNATKGSNESSCLTNSGWFDLSSISSKVSIFSTSTSSTISSWWEENSAYVSSKGNLLFSSALSGGVYTLVPNIIRDVAHHEQDANNFIKLARIALPVSHACIMGSPGPLLGLMAPAIEYGFELSSTKANAISVVANAVASGTPLLDCGISFVGSVAGSTVVPKIYKFVKPSLVYTYNFCKTIVYAVKDRIYKPAALTMDNFTITLRMRAGALKKTI